MNKKILYLFPSLLFVWVLYNLFELIIGCVPELLDGDFFVCVILVPNVAIYLFLLIAEYFVIIKKSRTFAFILTILLSLGSLLFTINFVSAILGYFGVTLKTPGVETIGDFVKSAFSVLFYILCAVSHYLLYKKFKKENNLNQPKTPTKTSLLAIFSLVLSFSGLTLPGIICGHLANNKIKNNQSLGGKGLALAGLIIGYVSLAFHIIMFIVLIIIIIFKAPSESKEITVEIKSVDPKEVIYIENK